MIGNAVIDWQRRRPNLIHLNQHAGWEADLAEPDASQTSELTRELTERSLVFAEKVKESFAHIRDGATSNGSNIGRPSWPTASGKNAPM